MQNLIEYLVKALVDEPDLVEIKEVPQEEATTYEVRVAPGDLGKVIGKQGRIANALRTVAKAAAMKNKRKVYVENHRLIDTYARIHRALQTIVFTPCGLILIDRSVYCFQEQATAGRIDGSLIRTHDAVRRVEPDYRRDCRSVWAGRGNEGSPGNRFSRTLRQVARGLRSSFPAGSADFGSGKRSSAQRANLAASAWRNYH